MIWFLFHKVGSHFLYILFPETPFTLPSDGSKPKRVHKNKNKRTLAWNSAGKAPSRKEKKGRSIALVDIHFEDASSHEIRLRHRWSGQRTRKRNHRKQHRRSPSCRRMEGDGRQDRCVMQTRAFRFHGRSARKKKKRLCGSRRKS